MAQPGYGSVRGNSNANTEVRGRVGGEEGVGGHVPESGRDKEEKEIGMQIGQGETGVGRSQGERQ